MTITLCSPLDGWAAPLSEVPDPVFADRMLGDGIAIHPVSGVLRAPCEGVVLTVHSAGHALTLRCDSGVELLIHIGLETVALAGDGFIPRVAVGDHVSRGDVLIDFDLDRVALSAASLVTPLIITNGEAFRVTTRTTGRMVTTGEALISLEPIAEDANAPTLESGPIAREILHVPMAHGIHARPAARIAAIARDFAAQVTLIHRDARTSATSAIGLLALDAAHGAELVVEATGPDADAAVAAIAALIRSGMGEASLIAAPAPPATPAPRTALPEGQFAGVTAAPGMAMGIAARFAVPDIDVPELGDDPAAEAAALDGALAQVRADLTIRAPTVGTVESAILAAHQAFLDDTDLRALAKAAIAKGASAGHAWRTAIRAQADRLAASSDPRLAERADDLLDIERQVLIALTGASPPPLQLPENSVLIARDLLPSQVIGLDVTRIAALCLERGGPTSHVAILAASMGLPALVAIGGALSPIADGTRLICDADDGRLIVDPDPTMQADYAARIADRASRRAAALADAKAPCRTADGTRIELFANIGSVADARIAAEHGAEGSGLVRTEFLFLERDTAPDEREQTAHYQAIAEALSGRPVIVRLLDIGGDKPAPYLPIAAEDNPALGLRGIRVGLAHPDLLAQQIRAILRTQPAGQCRIMVPMVASLAELRAVRAMANDIANAMALDAPPSVGVMIETPAAAMTADLIAAEADFLSIGTNDLTQYVLAMDRGNQAVADQIDALHPAVLRLIAQTCTGAAAFDRMVGVCGGAASDAAAIPLLIGLGVRELSVTPRFVPEAKAIVRRLSIDRCRDHAAAALRLPDPAAVRALARAFVREEMLP